MVNFFSILASVNDFHVETTTNILSQKEVLKASQQQDWGELQVILMAHTLRRLIFRYGVQKPKEELKELARSYISEVQELILIKGSRRWNIDHYTTFQEFIISVIDSHLNNQLNKSTFKKVDFEEQSTRKGSAPSPEAELEFLDLREKVFKMLNEEGASDDEMIIFECMAEGITKPKEIREELGITEKDFHNLWRKLDRRLQKIRKKL